MGRSIRLGVLLWTASLSGCAGPVRSGPAGGLPPPRVLWVGDSGSSVLPGALRKDSVVVRAVPARSEWWARRLILDGFRPDAVVFSGRAAGDSMARAAWGAMAERRMAREPAFYVHARDPVAGEARRTWLARTDSAGDSAGRGSAAGSAGLDRRATGSTSGLAGFGSPEVSTSTPQVSISLDQRSRCDRIRRYGDWERAGVLADPTRWHRLSEVPAERLLPCATGDVERQAEVASRLRKALPVAPRLDPSRRLRVVLDVGHFPRDDSAPIKGQGMVTPRGVDEFELNRKAALALAAALRDSLGAEMVVYNADGLERTLRGRTQAARRLDADLFLSIHHDAVSSSEASTWIWNGVERLYCDSVRGFSLHVHDSSVNFPQAFALARSIGTSLRAGGRVANLHHARNGRELLDSLDAVYRSDFGVLLSARMPAILIECGVALNREEELVLDSDEGRAEFARLVASGARRWLEAGAPDAPGPMRP